MRFGTSLFAALVLAGTLANAARAQLPGVSAASPGPYSTYGPGVTIRPASGYTGPYSVYGQGLTYRQDLGYTGPYSTRYPSASSPAQTPTNTYSSLRTTGLTTQTGNGRGVAGDAPQPNVGRAPVAGGRPGVSRYRYVRISIAGNAVQAIVIP